MYSDPYGLEALQARIEALQAHQDRLFAEQNARFDAIERKIKPADLPLRPFTEVGAHWIPDGDGGWAQQHVLRPDIAEWVQDTLGPVCLVVVGGVVVLRGLEREVLTYRLRWR